MFPCTAAALLLLSLFPRPSPASARQTPPPRPQPAPVAVFDAAADARSQIDGARQRAGQNNRRVLVVWGAESAEPALALDRLLKRDSKLARELLYEYDVVRADVLLNAANAARAAELGAPVGRESLPALTVLDAGGKVLGQERGASFEQRADGAPPALDPKALLAWLSKFRATPLVAEEVYRGALARAKKEGKRLFLRFGAPW